MAFANYREWRQALHNMQLEIDNFDEKYWNENYGIQPQEDYDAERRILIEALDAHYAEEHLYTV